MTNTIAQPKSLSGTAEMPSLPGVYKITNEVTGDFYIGGTINLSLRAKNHCSSIRHRRSAPLLQKSFDKYGWVAHRISVLEVTDVPMKREREFILELHPALNAIQLGHEFDVVRAADAVGCHENKFGEWWHRTERKLISLALTQPDEFRGAVNRIIATAMEGK